MIALGWSGQSPWVARAHLVRAEGWLPRRRCDPRRRGANFSWRAPRCMAHR